MHYSQKYLAITCIISGIASIGCVASHAHSSKPNNHIELLFFQQAKFGSIKPILKSETCYELKLNNVKPHITYFSNTPNRQAGKLTISQFLQTLTHDQSVENIKPNAILTMTQNTKDQENEMHLIGTLGDARYYHKTFQYTLCLFNNNPAIKAGELREVNLFIDPIHRWPP